MRLILSILMLVASIAGFAVFIVPHYNQISTLRAQTADYQTVLTNARQLKEQMNTLGKRYNSFDPTKLAQLDVMLPANPENMKLILALQNVASQYSMVLQNVKIDDPTNSDASPSRPTSQSSSDLGTLTINFSVAGPYNSFTGFVRTIEKSLRMIEVQKIGFSASDQYTVSVKTYWLK
jgi:Tfp pilus assembly protein PilO